MKTPMQEVYENFNKMSDADFKSWMLNTDLLEEEKRLSVRFAEFWAADHDHPESYYLNAEEAYNEKYGERLLKELARKASPWNWEVEETETNLIFKVNGVQVYYSTKAPSKPKLNG